MLCAEHQEPLAGVRHKAAMLGVAQSEAWRALLHHDPVSRRSPIEDGGFFLSPTGHEDSGAELEATLTAMAGPPSPGSEHAQCRFAARYAYLDSVLGFDSKDVPPVRCEAASRWRSPRRVSVVFAAADLQSPPSAFGHVFLRLGGAPGRLTDATVGFSAAPVSATELSDTLPSTLVGRYQQRPYFAQVTAYGARQARDLWEYELDLSETTRRLLMLHLWELSHLRLPYDFFAKNCASYTLAALRAVLPQRATLASPRLYVSPVALIKMLHRTPGLVRQRVFRPAARRALQSHISALGPSLTQVVTRLVEDPDRPVQEIETLPPTERRAVADAALAYADLRHTVGAPDAVPRTPEDFSREQQLRLARGVPRAEGAGCGADIVASEGGAPSPPEHGHAGPRAGMGVGLQGIEPYTEVSWRLAQQDPLDAQAGYVLGSRLEVLQGVVRLRRGGVELRSFDLLHLVSLGDDNPLSWQVRLGYWEAAACRPGAACSALQAEAGGGVARPFWGGRAVGYALAQARGGGWPAPPDLTTGLKMGVLVQATRFARVVADATLEASPLAPLGADVLHWRCDVGASLQTSEQTALRISGVATRRQREAALGIFVYF